MNKRLIPAAALAMAFVWAGSNPAAAGPERPTTAADAISDAANQTVVENLYRAFAVGDMPTIVGLLSPDLVWIEAESGPYADLNPYLGPGAVFEGIFGRIGAGFEGFTVTPATLLPSGDRVVSLGRYTGTNRGTGESLDAQFVHVFTVRDGKITHMQQYTDTAQWMDVVTSD